MQYGKITLNSDFVRDFADDFIEAFHQIKFLPLVISDSDKLGMMDYFGFSPNFRDISVNEVSPEYRIKATYCVDEKTKYTVEPVNTENRPTF